MLLKKINKKKIVFVFLFVFISFKILAKEEKYNEVINYLYSIDNFSANFIQDDGQTIEEGKLFIGQKRTRVQYNNPSKILIILSKNKAMYYNIDLEEVEFFDPKNTYAWFFYEIFQNPDLLKNSRMKQKENFIMITKEGTHDDKEYNLEIYFEDNPLLIRKIILNVDNINLSISIFGHNLNESFERGFFKLIPPKN